MRSSFFNSDNGDRKYRAEHWAEYFAQFIGNGVYAKDATNMQVQAHMGRTVKIAVGSCFIEGYTGYADGSDVLLIDYGGSAPRIDRIVARLDLPKKWIQPQVIKGEVAENPTAPDIIRDGTYYDICLAEITVPANATVISQSDIRDTRLDNGLCGAVTGLIKQISTTEFLAQYEAMLDDFFSQLGENDHITINTRDVQGRKLTEAIIAQQSFGSMFTMI